MLRTIIDTAKIRFVIHTVFGHQRVPDKRNVESSVQGIKEEEDGNLEWSE
jgi:hypothetical protein